MFPVSDHRFSVFEFEFLIQLLVSEFTTQVSELNADPRMGLTCQPLLRFLLNVAVILPQSFESTQLKSCLYSGSMAHRDKKPRSHISQFWMPTQSTVRYLGSQRERRAKPRC